MKVKLAKSAGFCFGVKRAMETVEEQIKNSSGPIYTYGPIIHNEQVVAELEKKGVFSVESVDELRKRERGIVIIRSHGVAKHISDAIAELGHKVVDATCPFVKRIHKIVWEESNKGKQILIIGNSGHPEVEGIRGWSKTKAYIVQNTEEVLEILPDLKNKDVCVVSQTTFNLNKFKELVDIFKTELYNVNVVNTICNATEERQTEAAEIAKEADAMIVIGGSHSSNSRKLYEICSGKCANTYFIQTLDDLHMDLTETCLLVGITAGASTPNNIIEEVQNYVRDF